MIKGKGFNFPWGFCLAAVCMRTPCDVDNGQRPSCGVLVICPRVLGVSAETRVTPTRAPSSSKRLEYQHSVPQSGT